MDIVGLVPAVLAALGFAVSTSLQHHVNTGLVPVPARPGGAAADEPDDDGHRLGTLVRRPWWVVGQVVALAAFALHAWALKIGLLVVVQPVVVSGIVLAVPVRAALERRAPRWREVGTVALTAAGLALFLVAVRPGPDGTHPGTGTALAATGTGVIAAVVAARWARARRGHLRAGGYGVAAGVLFGVTAGLVKLAATAVGAAHGLGSVAWALLTAWPTWLVPLVGVSGVALNQKAYRAGPLAASMPVLNIVDVLVAVAFGAVVFDEVPAHRPVELAGQVVGVALMLIGLRRLAGTDAAEAPAVVPERSCVRSGS